jgi:hypothetical protein
VILFKYQLDKYSTDGPHNPGHCACVSPANGGSACGHNHYVSQECLHSEDKDRVPVPANSYRDVCTLNCLRDRAQKQGRQSRSGGVQAGSFNSTACAVNVIASRLPWESVGQRNAP